MIFLENFGCKILDLCFYMYGVALESQIKECSEEGKSKSKSYRSGLPPGGSNKMEV